MHKEKVSRREIGSLTTSKTFPSHQKIVPPPSSPCLEPYYRRPLSFSILDDIGHGMKVSEGWDTGWAFWVPSVPRVALVGAHGGSAPPCWSRGVCPCLAAKTHPPRLPVWGGDTVACSKGKLRHAMHSKDRWCGEG